MSNPMAITEWARVKSILKEATKVALESTGHSWDTLRELESDALSQMTDEMVETQYGRVQKIPEGLVQYKVRKIMKPDEEMLWKPRLKLLTNNQIQTAERI